MVSALLHCLLLAGLASASIIAAPGRDLETITLLPPVPEEDPQVVVPLLDFKPSPQALLASFPSASRRLESPEANHWELSPPQPLLPLASERRRDLLTEIEALRGPMGEPGEEGRSGAGGNDGPSAEFFGIVAAGAKFVFVVDCSLSMAGQKWSDACYELQTSIAGLSEGQSFYVVFFDGESHPMFAPADAEEALLPANAENFARFRQWLATVQLGFNTSPCLSVKRACQLKPDAIFLLSDGEFSDPTAAYLRSHNQRRAPRGAGSRQIAVHTVCFYSREGRKMLERIAGENGGHCSIIGLDAVP